MKLYIKYMVRSRCKMVVKDELKKMKLHYIMVDLGDLEIMEDLSFSQREELKAALLVPGLKLMDNKKASLIEKTKNVIIDMVHRLDDISQVNYSDYIFQKIDLDYKRLSILFLEIKGITIKQFIIVQKIEPIKELIKGVELSISEIAWMLNYNSVAHLSLQFKKSTGLTPSHYKQLIDRSPAPPDKLDITQI